MKQMTDGTLMDSNLLKFSPVPGSKLQSFFSHPPSLVLSCHVFEVSFLLYAMVHNLFFGEISSTEFSGKRISTPSFSKFIFIPSCLNKNLWDQYYHALQGKKKEKPPASLALLEMGGC